MPEHSEDEAYQAIITAENVLRDLIESELGLASDADWYGKSGLTAGRLDKWKAKREEEAKRRDGVVPSSRLVEYSELHDLVDVLRKNWPTFAPCLGALKDNEALLGRLADFRVATMHGRALVAFERALAVGISGQVRNQVTIYRSQGTSEPGRFFPRIEYVRDSHGNVAPLATGLVLHPGDSVRFEGAAWDPEGAPVLWRVKIGFVGRTLHEERSNEIAFTWNITEPDIGEKVKVAFWVTSERAYHRLGANDDSTSLGYTVLPRA